MLKKIFGKNKKDDDKPDIPTRKVPTDAKGRVKNQIYRNLAVPVAYEKGTVAGSFVDKIDDEEPMMNEDEAGLHLFGAESQEIWNECEEYEAFVVNTDLKDTLRFMKKKKCVDFIVLCKGNEEVKFTFKEMCNIAGYDPADFDGTEAAAMAGAATSTRFIGRSNNAARGPAPTVQNDASSSAHASTPNDNDLARPENDQESLEVFVRCKGIYMALTKEDSQPLVEIDGHSKTLIVGQGADDIFVYLSAKQYNVEKYEIRKVNNYAALIRIDKEVMKMMFLWGANLQAKPHILPKMCLLRRRAIFDTLADMAENDRRKNVPERERVLEEIIKQGYFKLITYEYGEYKDKKDKVDATFAYTRSDVGIPYILCAYTQKDVDSVKQDAPQEDVGVLNIAFNEALEIFEYEFYAGIRVDTDAATCYFTSIDIIEMIQRTTPYKKVIRSAKFNDQMEDAFNSSFINFITFLEKYDYGFNFHTTEGRDASGLIAYALAGKILGVPMDDLYQELKQFQSQGKPGYAMSTIMRMAARTAEQDASISALLRNELIAQAERRGHSNLLSECLSLAPPSYTLEFFEDKYALCCMAKTENDEQTMKNIMTQINEPQETIDKYVTRARKYFPALLSEWLCALSTNEMKTESPVKVFGIDIRAAYKLAQTRAGRNNMNHAQLMHIGYKMLLDIGNEDGELYAECKPFQDEIDAGGNSSNKSTPTSTPAQPTQQAAPVVVAAPTQSQTVSAANLPSDFVPKNPTIQQTSGSANGGLPVIYCPREWSQRGLLSLAMKSGIVDFNSPSTPVGIAVMPDNFERLGQMSFGWVALTNKQYQQGGAAAAKQTSQPTGKLYDSTKFGKNIDEYPHNKCDNEEILTYKMPNGELCTFKAIDLKRAERSVLVECLTKLSMDKDEATDALLYLYQYVDVLLEFGRYLMNIKPQNPIAVHGYTAEKLMQTTYLSHLGAYNYLIYLRNKPEEALDNLRKGLPTY